MKNINKKEGKEKMSEPLVRKENKATIGSIILLLLIMSLIGVCIYRITTFKKYNVSVKIILIGLVIVGIYFFFITLKDLINNIKLPKVLIYKIKEGFKVYVGNKRFEVIKFDDVEKIDVGTYLNEFILFYQASLVIRCKNRIYSVKQVKDVKAKKKLLESIVKENVE